MTRKEERIEAAYKYTNSDVVSSGNEHLAFGDFINGAEWADKTIIERAIKFFQSKSKHGMIEENINEFIKEFCKVMEVNYEVQ